jgi:DNA (cytosine-5)-methyltransferase 1
MTNNLTLASFFSGAGGLDLGMELAGFDVIWANEYDKKITPTFKHNFPNTKLNEKSISDINPDEIPKVFGFVGGPPCQSWSEAGSSRGISDPRGQVFLDYITLIKEKKPEFFVAENVPGILFKKHEKSFNSILETFLNIGYNVSYGTVNASDYGVPQDRKRVLIVGYKTEYGKFFTPPTKNNIKISLKGSIYDLKSNAAKPNKNNITKGKKLAVANHEYFEGTFSPMFMSRNRVRNWDQASFTIQAMARNAPIHPSAKKMKKISSDNFEFQGDSKKNRRLSVRECARIQTFPDNFIFLYNNLVDGYKMIGNAVPVNLAKAIGERIAKDLINAQKGKKKIKGKLLKF